MPEMPSRFGDRGQARVVRPRWPVGIRLCRDMRVALIGLGNAGSHIHLPALASITTASVVGACDPDGARRDHVAATYRVPVFPDAGTMLSRCRPDIVVIGTPPDSHADYCIRALDAAAHVICEKPFVSSLAEADAVLDAAQRADRGVAVNHEFREMPIFRAIRDEIARPDAPDLLFLQMWQLIDMAPSAEAHWRGQMAQRTLFEAGVHLVDFAMALFGERPASVQATTCGERGPATDAVVVVTLEFSRGRLAQLTQNRLYKGETQYFEARADTTSASLRASFGGRARASAGLYRSTRPHMRFEYGRSGLAWRDVNGRRTILARNPKDPTVAATRLVFEAAIEAFRTGGEPSTSGRRARAVLEVIAACYHSASTGCRLRLDDPVMQTLTAWRMGAARAPEGAEVD